MKTESPNVHSITEIGAVALVFGGCVLGVSFFVFGSPGRLSAHKTRLRGAAVTSAVQPPVGGSGLSGSGGTRHGVR
jgi:hypothetical protein